MREHDPTPSPSRRALLKQAAGGTLIFLLGPNELAWGAELVAVRVWPAQDYTRVTLESDTALNATFFSVDRPNRLVIDIEGLALSSQLKELVRKIRSDDPYIAGVRVGQYKPSVARLVIDLKQAIKPQVFGLAPVAAYRHRLVFDLHPGAPIDPRVALNAGTPEAPASSPTAAPSAPASPTLPGVQAPASAAQQSPAAVAGMAAQRSSEQAADAMNDALGEFIGGLRRPPADADRSDTRVATRTPPRPADKDTKPAARPEPRPTAERLEPIEPPPAATDAT